jgi:GrpB-like predicted nucleotidyltransferase (UPF0157 family)
MTTRTSESELFWIRQLSADTLDAERKNVLRRLLAAVPFASVMEVGSTALDDVVGKQDLDFAVRVSVQEFERARSALDSLLQRNDNQLSNSEYQGYIVASPLDVAVQLFVAGGEHDTFERFVVLLRARPDLRRAYKCFET